MEFGDASFEGVKVSYGHGGRFTREHGFAAIS